MLGALIEDHSKGIKVTLIIPRSDRKSESVQRLLY
jgi:hypothetical protein